MDVKTVDGPFVWLTDRSYQQAAVLTDWWTGQRAGVQAH
jgi:hypothetical protein